MVAVLPGDFRFAVTAQATKILEAIAKLFGHELRIETVLYGALAIDSCGDPLPQKL
jgi:3-isopropylmalate dehydrogenase